MTDAVKWIRFTVRYKKESMPPKRERHVSDARIYESQALVLLEFQQHDLKFRTSNGKYKYFICKRCELRVPIKTIESGFRCTVVSQPCRTLTDASAAPVQIPAPVQVPAPVQLCAVCQTSECMYACLPCFHKCACRSCASSMRQCPICRSEVVNWKQIFESGIEGTAEDIVAKEATIGPVRFPDRLPPPPPSDSELSDSSESVEYLPRQPSGGVEPPHNRPQRDRMPDEDWHWVLDTTYCWEWSEAALVARCGNRPDAMLLLQSLEWKLRGTSSALNRALARLVSMGFNEMPARVCLLMHDGEEGAALDELLVGSAYVGVNGDHVESVGHA
jgi:hypothetical protein